MTYVVRAYDEPLDSLLRRFKTIVEKAGVLGEFRRRQRFTPAAEARRLKEKAAARRRRSAARKIERWESRG